MMTRFRQKVSKLDVFMTVAALVVSAAVVIYGVPFFMGLIYNK